MPKAYFAPPAEQAKWGACSAWYTFSGLAELLEVERSTIYRWVNSGSIEKRYIRELPNGRRVGCIDAFLVRQRGTTKRLRIANANAGRRDSTGRFAPRDTAL